MVMYWSSMNPVGTQQMLAAQRALLLQTVMDVFSSVPTHASLVMTGILCQFQLDLGALSVMRKYTHTPMYQYIKIYTHLCIYKYKYAYPYIYTYICVDHMLTYGGFPNGSVGKESACNAGDASLTPGLGRCPGEGNGNPLQYSCLGSSMGEGA